MESGSTSDNYFIDRLHEAADLYNSDRLDECIEKTRALLAHPRIPRYHRMSTLITLSSTPGDWSEVNAFHERAEALWRVTRCYHPAEEDAELDTFLASLRESLDAAGAALEQEDPDGYDVEDAVNDSVGAHEESVRDETASMKSLDMEESSTAPSDEKMDIESLSGVPAINVDAPVDDAGKGGVETQAGRVSPV
jgi:hypothetical protein